MSEGNEDPAVRKGWSMTPVELLVIVSIIGILVGVLLPAVWQVRAAARRTQSSNNLRQIALGTLNYESAYMRFPAGENQINGGSEKFGWALAILPFMEASNLTGRVNGDEPWDSLNNSFVLSSFVTFYSSPCERKSFNLAGYGVLHYAACAEVISGDVGIVPGDDFDRSRFMFGEICDGYEPWAKPSSCRVFGNGIQFDTMSFANPELDGALMARANGAVEFVASTLNRPAQTFQGTRKQGDSAVPNAFGYELILEYSPVLKGWRANCWFSPNSKSYGGGKALNDSGLKQLIQDDKVVAVTLGGAHQVSAGGLTAFKGCAVTRLDIGGQIRLEDDDLRVLHGLSQLEFLNLRGEEFSDDAINELRLSLPNCEVTVR